MATKAKASRNRRTTTSKTYVERVNLAIDYVLSHLDEPLRLTNVARAAMFSPFHFHRVFQALMGVTLADFVKRHRLEKALTMMSMPSRSRKPSRRPSLTQIAIACGFSGSSDFSRSFKQQFGAAPSAFDVDGWRNAHRSRLESTVHLERLAKVDNADRFKAKIRELPARTVAYIRVLNPYQGDAVVRAVDRLVTWARRHSLDEGQWLGYQWENPEVVPLEQCKYHVAVEVPSHATPLIPDGEVGRFRFPAMKVAQVEVRGGIELELRSLQWLYGTWLPRSGYVPDDHPCFEAWIGPPFAHGMEYFEINAQLPVRKG